MMQKCLTTLIFLLVNCSVVFSQTNAFSSTLEKHLSDFPENCEVAIGIIDNDLPIKLGFRIVSGELLPTDNSKTLYEIGSISKTFTIALLMNEIEKGNMALEDSLQSHLAFQIKADTYQNSTLKIKHLVTHTSGLKKNPLTSLKRYHHYLKDFTPGLQFIHTTY